MGLALSAGGRTYGNAQAITSSDKGLPKKLPPRRRPGPGFAVRAHVATGGLMSAILSTASIFLNVGAAYLTRDIPMAFGRPMAHPVFWARVWTGVLAVSSAAVAFYSRELVALLGAIGDGQHAAGLAPALILGLWWTRATASAVVASGIVTVAGSIYFFMAQHLGYAASSGWWIPSHGFPSVGLVMLLSFAVFVVFVVVSFVTPPRTAGHE